MILLFLQHDFCFSFLPAINQILNEGTMDMEVIINNKTLDNGLNIIQLEQAVGAAIKCFSGAHGKYIVIDKLMTLDILSLCVIYFESKNIICWYNNKPVP